MKKEIEKLPEEAYSVLDRLDESEIARELAGLIEYGAQDLIYSFKIEGRDITGLSWPGAKALARWMATQGHPLDAAEKDISDDEETWYADVKMVDQETGLGLWGTSKARKMKQIHVVDSDRNWVKNPDGSWKYFGKPDEHSRTIALNKAQRNAILAHVPDKMIAEFIKQAIDEGRIRQVSKGEVQDARARPRREVRPRREPKKSAQLKLGRIDANVIAYNLKTIDIYVEDGDVSILDEDDGFYVEPSKGLTDDDYKRIDETLTHSSMGAEWLEETQRWVIWKETEDR